MGHTHYWQFNKKTASTVLNTRRYNRTIAKINLVVKRYNELMPKGSDLRLSGYSAFTSNYGGVNFNGCRGNDHEAFILRECFNENEAFNFCKTARKPYDAVVCAALIILKHYMQDAVEISSDGKASDWSHGLAIAKEITGLKSLIIPKGVKP